MPDHASDEDALNSSAELPANRYSQSHSVLPAWLCTQCEPPRLMLSAAPGEVSTLSPGQRPLRAKASSQHKEMVHPDGVIPGLNCIIISRKTPTHIGATLCSAQQFSIWPFPRVGQNGGPQRTGGMRMNCGRCVFELSSGQPQRDGRWNRRSTGTIKPMTPAAAARGARADVRWCRAPGRDT